MIQPLHIKNALIWDVNGTTRRDLYTTDVVVDKPANDALKVDLDGYTIFPGLINAHDHLELNHYPRTKFRERYDNARQWSADVNERLDTEPYKSLRAYPLEDRCFIGGLKNLLCGATTVAHHNPLHKYLKWDNFPVNVVEKFGWAHSFYLSSEEEIQRSYKRTPKHIPWFIHLAEGTDEEAAGDYQHLKSLGCVGENTVIVHGVGMTDDDIADAAPKVRGLVWCPTTNHYLLGQTVVILSYTRAAWRGTDRHVALASDSRLTANGDLLNEIQFARHSGPYDAIFILQAVTTRPAHICGLKNVGHLKTGANGDWIVAHGWSETRADLALVAKGGIPQIGDPDVMAKFPYIQTVAATLDGKPKSIHVDLARRIHQCTLKEPGLEVDMVPAQRRIFSLW